MSQTLLLLNFDCLGPRYRAATTHATLTISTALTASEIPTAVDLLRPWRWLPTEPANRLQRTVRVFRRDGGSWIDHATVDIDESISRPTTLKDTLDAAFDDLADAADTRALLVFDPRSADADAATDRLRWAHLLEDVVRLPAPLGHDMGVALVFPLAEPIPDQLVAAPVVKVGARTWTPIACADVDGWVEVTYRDDLGASGDVVGITRSWSSAEIARVTDLARAGAGANDPELGMDDLWVRLRDTTSWNGTRWFAQLPLDAAEAAEYSRHLLDAAETVLRGTIEAPAVTRLAADAVQWLRDAVLVALRLGAHAGVTRLPADLRDGPAAPRTAYDILQRLLPGDLNDPTYAADIDSRLSALRAYEDDRDIASVGAPALRKWRTLLVHVLASSAPDWLQDTPGAKPQAPQAVPFVPELTALRALVARVCEPTTTRLLLDATWGQIPTTPPLPPTANAADLVGMPLRLRLLLDRLDLEWERMSTPTEGTGDDEPTRVRAALQAALQDKADRLFDLPATPLADPSPDDGLDEMRFRQRVRTALRARLAVAVNAVGPEAPSQDGDPQLARLLGPAGPLQSAHPLGLVIGPLRAVEVDSPASPAARLSGIGVLLRQAAPNGTSAGQPWRCLTLAQPRLLDAPLVECAVAPKRVVEAGRLQSWSVSYDNGPLTAESLLGALSNGTALTPHQSNGSPPPLDDSPLHLAVTLHQVEKSTGVQPWQYELPALKFGQQYDVACFGVSNAGALPAELAEADEPLRLRALSAATAVPDHARYPLRYLRRTPVAAPRLITSEDGNAAGRQQPPKAFVAPTIERANGVFPRGEELLADEPGELDAAHPAGQIGELILLTPNDPMWVRDRHALSFAVLPPASDLQVWHRWVAMDAYQTGSPSLATLADVFTAYHASAPPLDVVEARAADRSFDDPAAAKLLLRLTPLTLHPDSGALVSNPSVITSVLAWQPRPGATGMGRVQRLPIPISLQAGAASTIVGGSVTVAKGAVCQLEIATLVEHARYYATGQAAQPQARLRQPPSSDEITDAGITYVVAAVTRLTIEVATETLPTAEDLWRAIDVLGPRGESLAVGLDPAVSPAFDHVKEVRLERQRWNWTGRSLTEHFPYRADLFDGALHALQTPPLTPLETYAWNPICLWDAEGFGDRSDDDMVIERGVIKSPARSGMDRLARGVTLHEINLAADARAAYYRYRAYASSRYRGLMANAEMTAERASSEWFDWRRLLIRARVATRLPQPRLRFLLPLTQPLDSNQRPGATATVLALLHQTWTETLGLPERLEVSIAQATRNYPAARPEVGFDPIDRAAAYPTDTPLTAPVPTPPLGLTFDLGVSTPLPVTSAWELRFAGATIEPGMFIKLSLRSTAEPAGVAVPADTLRSEATNEEWIQLGADFTRFAVAFDTPTPMEPDPVFVGDLRLSATGQILSNGVPVRIKPNQPDIDSRRWREIYVLLTRLVSEADGQTVSEAPVCLGSYRDASTTLSFAPAFVPGTLRARIFEVEWHVDRPVVWNGNLHELSAHPLFDALFPRINDSLSTDTDARARIVRVSPPID